MSELWFFLEDANTEKKYRFQVHTSVDEFDDVTCSDEGFAEFISALEEEYGVLDACGDHVDGVVGGGYSSYEVSEENFPSLLERIKGWFKENHPEWIKE